MPPEIDPAVIEFRENVIALLQTGIGVLTLVGCLTIFLSAIAVTRSL